MLFVIQGWIDRERIARRNAYLIHCSMVEKPVSITEYLPLPWDDELEENSNSGISDEEFYKQTVSQDWFNQKWWNN